MTKDPITVLRAEIEERAETWAACEFGHAKNLGAGGPGMDARVTKCRDRFNASLDKLLAAATAPATIQPAGDDMVRAHASVIVTNICAHAKAGHTMTGWLDDACTSAEILQQRLAAAVSAPVPEAKAEQPISKRNVLKIAARYGYRDLPTARLAYSGFRLQDFAQAIAQFAAPAVKHEASELPPRPKPVEAQLLDGGEFRMVNTTDQTDDYGKAMYAAGQSAPPIAVQGSGDDADRKKFETLANDSYGFKRSRRGTYVNTSVARDWKWFRLGIDSRSPVAAPTKEAE